MYFTDEIVTRRIYELVWIQGQTYGDVLYFVSYRIGEFVWLKSYKYNLLVVSGVSALDCI